jgi:hypothetical protein
MSTLITPKARAAAFDCATGHYQRSVLLGDATWSGSELTGTAARYGGRYRDSREALLGRLQEAGLSVERTTGARGRIVVVVMTAAERKRAKDIPAAQVAAAAIEKAARAKAAASRRAAREAALAERHLAEDIPILEFLAHAR